MDYGKDRNVVCIEILNTSKRSDAPFHFEHEMIAKLYQ